MMKSKAKAEKKIINPVRKCVVGLILTLILSFILWVFLVVINIFSTQEASNYTGYVVEALGLQHEKNEDTRYDGIFRSGEEIALNMEEATQEYYEECRRKTDLSARANYDRVVNLGDGAIGKQADGGIVKIEDGRVLIGEGMRSGIRNFAGMYPNSGGMFDYYTPTINGDRKDILFYSRIRGPYYYVEIVNGKELLEYLEEYVAYTNVLAGIESAYNVELYLVCPDRKNSRYFYNLDTDLVYYGPMTFYKEETASTADYGMPSDREGLLALNGQLVASNEDALSYIVRDVPMLDCIFVIAASNRDVVDQAINETSAGIYIILILTITFIIWLTSVFREMTQGLITDKKKEQYAPGRIKLIALSYGILCAIIVFGASLFFRSINSIYKEITRDQYILEVIDAQIDNNEDYLKNRNKARTNLYLEYGRRAAELIEENRQLNNKEDLQAINRIIGSEYIMLFDSEGKEIGTSADYINMELGRDDVEHPVSSADFRRILKGVPGIAHSAFKDEITGRTLEQYGVRMIDEKTGRYGVLLIAVKPQTDDRPSEPVNRILRSMTPTGKLSFVLEPKSGNIKNCMSEDFMFYYYTAEDLGFGSNMLRDGISDFTRIAGEKHLCISKVTETGDIIYICTPNSQLFSRGFRYGFACAFGFLIVFALVFLYLIFGYSSKMIEAAENAEKEKKKEDSPKTDITSRSRLLSVLRHITKNATPERKAMVAFEIMVAWCFLSMFRSLRSGTLTGDRVLGYVLAGKWNRGLNIFSVTSIVMLLCVLALGMMFVRFFTNTLGKMLGSRGKTICRLFSNLFNYLGFLVFIYYALSYLGVDTNAILASVGVIGIGVSMGARDLIADIFAGVSMIFEGEYQVGDIVNIDGYRGMVQEVGVRSTRLVGRGGNVKVIGNKDIKSVTNLTKMNSWVAITIRVDVNYSIRDAEEIINQTLPQIAAKHKEIISGPFYKGILSVEMGYAVLSIIAECYEDDYHKVERALVREILLALREKNVPVR